MTNWKDNGMHYSLQRIKKTRYSQHAPPPCMIQGAKLNSTTKSIILLSWLLFIELRRNPPVAPLRTRISHERKTNVRRRKEQKISIRYVPLRLLGTSAAGKASSFVLDTSANALLTRLCGRNKTSQNVITNANLFCHKNAYQNYVGTWQFICTLGWWSTRRWTCGTLLFTGGGGGGDVNSFAPIYSR